MTKAFVSAVRLLARREHGAHELAQKLLQKKHPELEIQDALNECQRLGLQSDARFVESLCRTRIRQGHGPARIRQDLQQVQIDRDLIEQVLDEERDTWVSYARDVWMKKYSEQEEPSFAAKQKQKQFLLYRGFSVDTINRVFREIKHEQFRDKTGIF